VKKVIWINRGLAEDQQTFNGNLPGGIFSCAATGGHTDEFVRFVDSNTLLLAEVIPEERNHPIGSISHKAMEEAFELLSKETDQEGKPFKIIRIPLPPLILETATPTDELYQFMQTIKYNDDTVLDGKSDVQFVLAASYCNFLVTNGVVLLPKYFKENRKELFRKTDEEARIILQKVFPDRRIIQIDAENINIGGGGIHCITQQECL